MKVTVTENIFRDMMNKSGRGENFSYEGLGELFQYLDEMDEGEEIEFDPVSIDSQWGEYTGEELLDDYGYLLDADETEDMDEEEVTDLLVDELRNKTTVLEVENGNYLVMTDFGG
jgi:hypothetical protein